MTALGWNGLGRPLKNSELSELEQKPSPIRRMTGKSLIIIQTQAKPRRIRIENIVEKGKGSVSNLVSETENIKQLSCFSSL